MLTGLRHGVRCAIGLTAMVVLLTPSSAFAQITRVSSSDQRNAVGVTIGGFLLRGFDSRDEHDTILADRDSLAFELSDFNNLSLGGEWLVAVGDYLEAGAGIGFYQKTVPTVYRNFQNANGSEIEQDLKLRIVPLTGTLRFLPIGRKGVAPYLGVGIGAFNWRYSEIGEFVDFSDNSIFSGRFIAKGTAVGPIVLGGIRVPVGDALSLGGEVQWQKAVGDTGGLNEGFLGEKIDLGGVHALVTLHIRF